MTQDKLLSTETIMSIRIKTEGGANVHDSVNTSGGNFIGRDSIVNQNNFHISAAHENQFDSNILPQSNIEIFKLIYILEVGLRELVINELTKVGGSQWWKQRIPGDIVQKFKEGLIYQKNTKWVAVVPHHPIYYIDFSDLLKIIQRRDNWEDAFRSIFGSRTEIIVGTLQELEPIRNSIAHNRKTSNKDLEITIAAYNKIASAVGHEQLLSFVSSCTLAEDLPVRFKMLLDESIYALNRCVNYKVLEELAVWSQIRHAWWFDSDYLGYDIECIKAYYEKLYDYSQLSRIRGSGHRIEAWVKSHDMIALCDRTVEVINNLIAKGNSANEFQ